MSCFQFLLLNVLCSLGCIYCSQAAECLHGYCDKQIALFEWVEQQGGYVSPKIELTTGPDPSWHIRGVFAKAPIQDGEIIANIPSSAQICQQEEEDENTTCHLSDLLADEMALTDRSSVYSPYLAIMEDHEIDMTSFWSEEERELLNGLYPLDWDRFLLEFEDCDLDTSDPVSVRAFQLTQSRTNELGSDDGYQVFNSCFIPAYDLMNQVIKYKANVSLKREGGNVILTAWHDIAEGAQLVIDYGVDNVGRLFRDHAFINQAYPRVWLFRNTENVDAIGIGYKVDESNTNNLAFNLERFKTEGPIHGSLVYRLEPRDRPDKKSIVQMLETLKGYLALAIASEPVGVKEISATMKPERHAIAVEYRRQYVEALEAAISHLEFEMRKDDEF